MTGTRISSGSTFEQLAGYARAVVLPDPGGDWILVSGTTGYDYATMAIDDDVEAQTRQCFANIDTALSEAGSSLADLVRIRVFIADAAEFERVARIVGEHTRAALPANTTVVTALTAPQMKVEIEVTARKPIG